MSKLSIVKLASEKNQEEIEADWDEFSTRVKAGIFETIFIVAINHDGSWITHELGKIQHPLKNIGMLETLKHKVLRSSEGEEDED